MSYTYPQHHICRVLNRSWIYHTISGWNSQFHITGILTAQTLGLFKNYVSTTKWGERTGMHIGVK